MMGHCNTEVQCIKPALPTLVRHTTFCMIVTYLTLMIPT